MYALKVTIQVLVLWVVLSVAAISTWRWFDRTFLSRGL